jgi:hypothetical protein
MERSSDAAAVKAISARRFFQSSVLWVNPFGVRDEAACHGWVGEGATRD